MAPSVETHRCARLREALLGGRALTRQEAQAEFGISGSTFRWAIERMRNDGVPLDYEVELGHRQSHVKRWSVEQAPKVGSTRKARP